MNFTKLLFLGVIGIALYSHIHARQMEVFLDDQSLITKQGMPAKNQGIIDATGMILYKNAPTYRQICKSIIKEFNLDAKMKDFTVKYVDTNTGKSNFLKSKLHKLSPKKRSEFFDSVTGGENNMITLVVVSKNMMPDTMMSDTMMSDTMMSDTMMSESEIDGSEVDFEESQIK